MSLVARPFIGKGYGGGSHRQMITNGHVTVDSRGKGEGDGDAFRSSKAEDRGNKLVKYLYLMSQDILSTICYTHKEGSDWILE